MTAGLILALKTALFCRGGERVARGMRERWSAMAGLSVDDVCRCSKPVQFPALTTGRSSWFRASFELFRRVRRSNGLSLLIGTASIPLPRPPRQPPARCRRWQALEGSARESGDLIRLKFGFGFVSFRRFVGMVAPVLLPFLQPLHSSPQLGHCNPEALREPGPRAESVLAVPGPESVQHLNTSEAVPKRNGQGSDTYPKPLTSNFRQFAWASGG